MFTGIVEAVGTVDSLERDGADARLRIAAGGLDLGDAAVGDSITVDGACLTATTIQPDGFTADVSTETLACTTLGNLIPGRRVNLERALLPTTRLGGHLVSGHVDGVATVEGRAEDGRSVRLSVRVPDSLARYVAAKGSIAIDGVSLTVNDVEGGVFGVNLVPHTLAVTALSERGIGDRVNVEVDRIARYVERLLLADAQDGEGGVTREMLARCGFL